MNLGGLGRWFVLMLNHMGNFGHCIGSFGGSRGYGALVDVYSLSYGNLSLYIGGCGGSRGFEVLVDGYA